MRYKQQLNEVESKMATLKERYNIGQVSAVSGEIDKLRRQYEEREAALNQKISEIRHEHHKAESEKEVIKRERDTIAQRHSLLTETIRKMK